MSNTECCPFSQPKLMGVPCVVWGGYPWSCSPSCSPSYSWPCLCSHSPFVDPVYLLVNGRRPLNLVCEVLHGSNGHLGPRGLDLHLLEAGSHRLFVFLIQQTCVCMMYVGIKTGKGSKNSSTSRCDHSTAEHETRIFNDNNRGVHDNTTNPRCLDPDKNIPTPRGKDPPRSTALRVLAPC